MAARNKEQVARQFSRAAGSYDQAAGVQQRAVSHLLDGLTDLSGHWLDIGCGTGVALPHLRYKGATAVTGIDMATGMLTAATQHADEQTTLLLADADQLPLGNASAAGIFSSLMLQWSEHPATTLREWRRVLSDDGQLAVATLLPGTQRELQQAWRAVDDRPHVNHFTSRDELYDALKQAGFTDIHSEQACLCEHYSSMTELLRRLKQIGATNVNQGRRDGLGGRALLRQAEASYPVITEAGCTLYPLSYEVLWIYARAGDQR